VIQITWTRKREREGYRPFGPRDLVVDTSHPHAEFIVDAGLVVGGGIDDEY
jgi:hypothetical protein